MWCDVSNIFREEVVVVQFEYDHYRDMSNSLLSYILDKEDVGQEVYKTTSKTPKLKLG